MERAEQRREKVTFSVVMSSIIACIGGLIFGYVGILGQITVQDIFYDLFLIDVYNKNPRDFDYCKYSNRFDFPVLSGPIYLAGSLAAVLAYPFTTKYGCRKMILFSGVLSLIGSIIGAVPFIYTVIPGYVILGAGIGFGFQAGLLYLSEIAPRRFRGALSTVFQLAIALGILCGNMIRDDLDNENKFTLVKFIFGWGFPVIPAVLLVVGAKKYLIDSPNGLVERGMAEKARQVLEKIRGTEDVDAEFQDIVEATEFSKQTRSPKFGAIKNILEKRNRPQLVMAILMPMFQNLTGVLFVFVYAPLMFHSMGSRLRGPLYSTAINGTTLVVSTLISMATVDKLGRKALLISGGVLMIICQVIIAIMLGTNLLSDKLSKDGLSIVITVLIGIFVMAYGWSWGPLGWTIPSEILTHENRSVGHSISVSINLVFSYIVLQFFIPLLCAFKYGLFLFFACWVVVMTIFVFMFLPETKGVPIEETSSLWTKHWFWSRFVAEDSEMRHATLRNPIPLAAAKNVCLNILSIVIIV